MRKLTKINPIINLNDEIFFFVFSLYLFSIKLLFLFFLILKYCSTDNK